MNAPIINPVEFITFALVLLRVSVLLLLAPIFGSALLPPQVKIALALVTALMLTPVVQIDVSAFPDTVFGYAPLVLNEVLVGLIVSLLIRLIFEGVKYAGQFIGFQMGFAIANVIDPQSGAQTSVLAQFAYILALLAFLGINGHHIVIRALNESFQSAPPGFVVVNPTAFTAVIDATAQLFIIAIKIGGPALVVLFCAKVCMGIISKVVPQMNVLFVGMPLYIIIGLFIFGLSINFMIPILGRALTETDRTITNLLGAMGG